MKTTAESIPAAGEASPDETVLGRRAGPSPWLESLKVVLATRALFLLVAYAASAFLASSSGPPSFSLEDWVRWDARLFFVVAEQGYTSSLTDPHATAFFPLFPLLLTGLRGIGIPYVLGGMLISGAASVVAGAYLYRLVEEEVGEGSGRKALIYMCLFPTSVFLVAPYSEALFLAGAIPAFYYARRDRWHLAALPAAVAMGSRAAGLFLLFGLGWEFVRQDRFGIHRVGSAAVALIGGAIPLLAYGAYLARVKGDPFYFFIDQKDGWGRQLTDPLSAFQNTWDTWANPANPTNWTFAWRVEVLAVAVGLAFVAWALARREWGFGAYMGVFLLTLMTSTWYYSVPRMLLTFFPIYVMLASWTHRRSERHELVLLLSAPLAVMGVVVFTRGAWFF